MQQIRRNDNRQRRGSHRLESQLDDQIGNQNNQKNKNQSSENSSQDQQKAFKHLIEHVSQKQELLKFSQKYKDQTTEIKFVKKAHKQNLIFHARLYLLSVIIIGIIYFSYLIYRVYNRPNSPPLYKSLPINAVFLVVPFVVYFLAVKFQFFQLNFSNIQVLIFNFLLLEMSVNGNTPNIYAYIFKEIPVIFLCRVSYNQLVFLICVLISFVYNALRGFWWITDNYVYSVFVIEYFFFTVICIITSRVSNQKERNMFESYITQKQLTLVFHNLIKIFHDGVVIADKDQILYHNEQSLNIFNLGIKEESESQSNRGLVSPQNAGAYQSRSRLNKNQQGEERLDKRSASFFENNSNAESIQQQLKISLKEAVIDKEECQNMGINIENGFKFQFNNLAEYLQERFRFRLYQQSQRRQLSSADQELGFLNQIERGIMGSINGSMLSQEINMDGLPFLIQPEKIDEGGDVGGTGRNNNSNQEVKHIQVFTQSMFCNGKETILIALRDMTSWIEIERQQNLSKMKTVLFAQAAHEFRNPLNGIISSIDILHDQIKTDIGKKFYQIAKNCANLMLFLVNDILDFAQTEEKKLVLNLERFKLKDLLEQCTNILQFQAELKGLKILLDIDKSTPTYFTSDQNRLRQIIINLLSNAIKYTRKGFVKIVTKSHDRFNLEIQVQDTGVGISQEKIKTLFKVFTKIMEDRELNKQGVGLGLSISKKLASALGGDIQVESEKEVGSVFTLRIQNMENQLVKPSISGQSNSSKRTIKNNNGQNNYNSNGYSFSAFDPNRQRDNIYDVASFNSLPHQINDIVMTFPGNKKNKNLHWNQSQKSDITQNRHHSNINVPQFSQILETEEERKDDAKSFMYSEEEFRGSELKLGYNQHDDVILNDLQYAGSLPQIPLNDSLHMDSNFAQILIADDQPFNILSLETFLEGQGLSVDKAYDGESAYQKILNDQRKKTTSGKGFKLAILDNEMPLMSGLQVAIKIRQGQRSGILDKNLKIALSSGESSNEFTKLLYSLNDGKDPFDYSIGKPVDMAFLKKILKDLGLKREKHVFD